MGTIAKGTFVIAWAQSEVDGHANAPLTTLIKGAQWRWGGELVDVSGARDVLVLDNAIGQAELQQRASRSVRRLLGTASPEYSAYDDASRERLFDGGFDITDGLKRYEASFIDDPVLGSPLVMFVGEVPPANTDLWVIDAHISSVREAIVTERKAVVCFTPFTKILTPSGYRAIVSLREGDLISTKDNGPQPLRWMGHRSVSGARLHAMPELSPIRIAADALGIGQPDDDLIVSPDHRMLLSGPAARELFNAHEVLVSAKDLVNDKSVTIERGLRQLNYIHHLFDDHQVVLANGMETESFHPSVVGFDDIPAEQRLGLFARFPDLAKNQDIYGPSARRSLTGAEAAIMLHAIGQ